MRKYSIQPIYFVEPAITASITKMEEVVLTDQNQVTDHNLVKISLHFQTRGDLNDSEHKIYL